MKTSLSFCNRDEAVAKMNLWGKQGKSFFFLIGFDEKRCIVERPEDIPSDELLYRFPEVTNAGNTGTAKPLDFLWETQPESFESYRRSFDVVSRNLHAGNSFLTNLTCATPVKTDLTLRQIFDYAEARYKLWMKDKFVFFSPEIFVRIIDGMICSYPMKGTIDATLPDAENRLLEDMKESAEHATITDLIRNDLSQISDGVTVTRYRYIDKLQTYKGPLLQMSSEIRGRLPEDYATRLGDLFFRMLPAGSITGAPKKKTVDIIREAETYERGFYTGVAGFFDGKNLDSAVLIRFIEQLPDGTMVFKSGGGITFQSDVRAEYNEMKQKIYVPIY
ncbi:aminodeoxychorismate synthase component I [uncultured Bacteroides sp.]|uniref:aminodeoxychorismate synthase component I n=1 Tax=uncultured Bacteroides sp. TaxID=162156 RepID=UPI00261F593D|nr:aminodeoxychorismate synthase component I [uncultured Bacteroides sp.]